jgi:hypothetical protein
LSQNGETSTARLGEADLHDAGAVELLSNLDELSDEQVDALLRQMQTDQENNL